MVLFCLMLAVSPSSAELWCFSTCLIELSFDVFRTLPGSLLRLAGGTGGIRLEKLHATLMPCAADHQNSASASTSSKSTSATPQPPSQSISGVKCADRKTQGDTDSG
jgi:hypothetical protein